MEDRTPAAQAPATLLLRRAAPADVEAIAALWHDGWRDGHVGHVPEAIVRHRAPADFRKRVPARLPHTTVACAGSSVVGFVTIHDDEVEQLYVAAAARGSGVADELLRHAERAIAARHATAWLAVVPGNSRARRFYARNGWRDAGGLDYAAEIEGGTLSVPCRRYEKDLTRERET
jgi:ribosomal protein S18 acetylase RimI-like enzyme